MPRQTIALPARAVLPDVTALTSAQVRRALGVSKAVVCLWRRNHNLPRGVRVGNDTHTDTRELAAWLTERGVLVRMVPVSPEPAAPMLSPRHEAREAAR